MPSYKPRPELKSRSELRPIAMTLPDAIAYTGIGRTSFYNFFKEGVLVPRKAGSRTLIMVEELDALVRKLQKGVHNAPNPSGKRAAP